MILESAPADLETQTLRFWRLASACRRNREGLSLTKQQIIEEVNRYINNFFWAPTIMDKLQKLLGEVSSTSIKLNTYDTGS